MKKNKFSHALCTGVLSSLLMLGLILFAACDNGDDDGDNGPTVETPSISDVPDIPAGTDAVTRENAESFLSAIRSANPEIYSPVYRLISSNSTGEKDENKTWDFKDQTTETGKIRATSKGSETSSGSYEKVGDSGTESSQSDTTATTIADITSGNVTIKSGSKFAEKTNQSVKFTIKDIDEEGPSKYDYDYSSSEAYSFGLSVVTTDGKGGKIIFSATKSESFKGTITNSESPNITTKISGSLKVYGASDAEVYSQTIDDEDKLDDALLLIGYDGKR